MSSSKEDPRLELHKEIIRRGDALIARMHNLIRIANIWIINEKCNWNW